MIIALSNIRRITLRVPSQLHRALTQAAAERDVSLNRLAVQALELHAVQQKRRFPLKELSAILAPAAQTKGLTEGEMMRHIKDVRRRIWQERHRETVGASRKAEPA